MIRHKRQEARDKTKNCLSVFCLSKSVLLILWNYLSASTKLNVHLCFCKNWFSRHQRAEGEAIFQKDRLLRFATANLVMTLFFCLSITCYTLPKCKYTFNFVKLLISIAFHRNKKQNTPCLFLHKPCLSSGLLFHRWVKTPSPDDRKLCQT